MMLSCIARFSSASSVAAATAWDACAGTRTVGKYDSWFIASVAPVAVRKLAQILTRIISKASLPVSAARRQLGGFQREEITSATNEDFWWILNYFIQYFLGTKNCSPTGGITLKSLFIASCDLRFNFFSYITRWFGTKIAHVPERYWGY